MSYTVNPNQIGITTVGSSAGQITDASDIEAVNQWMKPVEIDEQELSKWLPPLRSTVNQQIHYIGQGFNPPITALLQADTAAADPTVDIVGSPADKGFKVNDKVMIRVPYSGQDVFYDPTQMVKGRISQIDSGSFELTANVGAIIPAGATVTVYSSATPMATAFGDANVFRGNRIAQTVHRLQSGLIKVDERLRHTPTHESKDHFLDDIEALRKTMNDKLEGAYINSTYVPESGTTPGEMRGMLDWADEIGANVTPLSGAQITIHHLRRAITQKRKTHRKRAGKTFICDIDTMECIDLVLEPYKLYDEKSNSISIQVDALNFRWGNVSFMPVMFPWPDGTALITDKEDWGAGNYAGMPWKPVRQDNAHVTGTWETFGIYGDFTLDCYDVYRQIEFTGINTFVDRYAGRRSYGLSG